LRPTASQQDKRAPQGPNRKTRQGTGGPSYQLVTIYIYQEAKFRAEILGNTWC